MKKQKIAVDFDGTVCEQGPFVGYHVIPYKPEPFVKEALDKLSEYFTIVIFSVRAQKKEGIRAIAAWMNKYKLPYSKITDKKEACLFYIDNKAIHYDGNWKKVLMEISTRDVE